MRIFHLFFAPPTIQHLFPRLINGHMILSNKNIFSTPRQPPWIPRGLIYNVKVGDVRPHAHPTENHGHKPVQLHPLPPPWVYNKRHSEFSPHSFLRAPPENWSPGQHLCPGRKSLLYDVSFLFILLF
jgi:hypothetical protein